jgi:hypothetical protein
MRRSYKIRILQRVSGSRSGMRAIQNLFNPDDSCQIGSLGKALKRNV